MHSQLLTTSAGISVIVALIAAGRILSGSVDDTSASPFLGSNLEEELSLGQRIPLACLDQVILERIPSISSKTAEKILRQRDAVQFAARHGHPSAITIVHGIGIKSGRFLERYITYEGRCDYR